MDMIEYVIGHGADCSYVNAVQREAVRGIASNVGTGI